jgi:hypothetical protein
MLARGVFSFYPPGLHASSCFPSKPFVSPTCRITVRNSFVSLTYAKTEGCTPLKMSARRHFHAFPVPTLARPSSNSNHSRTYTTRGSGCLVQPIPTRESLRSFISSTSFTSFTSSTSFSPFTSRSQSCYRPFTQPSPSLVTIIASQGTNSYTMPIAIRVPTVHFYRCDPLREMPS